MVEAHCRIGKITFKNGTRLTVIDTKKEDRDIAFHVPKRLAEMCQQHLDAGSNIAGYALVIWGSDSSTTADMQTLKGNSIPLILAPDLVRNRLLALKIEEWSVNQMRNNQ